MKQKIRRQRVYLKWVQGRTVKQIAGDLSISTSTVERDLATIGADMEEVKKVDWTALRNEGLRYIRDARDILLAEIEKAKEGSHVRANLLKTLLQTDIQFLQRVAQPPQIGRQYNIQAIKEEAMIVAKFVVQEHPELGEEFLGYLKKNRKVSKGKPVTINIEKKKRVHQES